MPVIRRDFGHVYLIAKGPSPRDSSLHIPGNRKQTSRRRSNALMQSASHLVLEVRWRHIQSQPEMWEPSGTSEIGRCILVPLMIVMTRKMSEPSEPIDPTPNERWRSNVFCYNPDDAALIVEKREGLGYSFNFANSPGCFWQVLRW
jgi:hypothetical protein